MKVFDLAFEALAYLVENRRALTGICLIPALLILVIDGIANVNQLRALERFAAEGRLPGPSDVPVLSISLALAMLAFMVLLLYAIVVWHRYILLREPPGAKSAGLFAPALRYLLYSLLIGLIAALVLVPLYLVALALTPTAPAPGGGLPFVFRVFIFVVSVGVFTIMFRMSFVLVESAVGRRSGGLGWSWATTRPLARQVVGLAVIVTVLTTAGEILVFMAAKLPAGVYGRAAAMAVVATATLFLQTFMSAAAMSLAYRRLVAAPGAGRGFR